MTGTSHLLLGTAVGATAAVSVTGGLDTLPGLCIAGGCILGSLFPDIDSKASKISYRLPIVSFFMRLLFGHRNVLHTPFVLILFGIIFSVVHLMFALPITFIVGFVIGYICHLLQDTVTKRGIMWLYPVSSKYISIIGITSGKSVFLEFILTLAIYSVIAGLFGVKNILF